MNLNVKFIEVEQSFDINWIIISHKEKSLKITVRYCCK